MHFHLDAIGLAVNQFINQSRHRINRRIARTNQSNTFSLLGQFNGMAAAGFFIAEGEAMFGLAVL